jgi:type IX secretion system PorP/SprF family membrane protein
MKKYFLTILTIFGLLSFSKGQDPHFTQFYANPIYLNPAFAGSTFGHRFISNYRNQWPEIQGGFVTYAASYDVFVPTLSGGVGVQVLHDRAGDGDLSTTSISGMYSYHLKLGKKFAMKFGLQAAYHKKSIDFSKLTFYDQIDKLAGFIRESAEFANLPVGVYDIEPVTDFSAGVIGFSEKFYFGFTANHINEPNVSLFGVETDETQLDMKTTAHAGMMIPLDNFREHKNYFSPNVIWQKQYNFMEYSLGAYYIRDYFVGGAWYRQTTNSPDAISVLIGLIKKPLKIGYSYDIPLSDVRFGSKGSHEIALILEFKTYKKPPPHRWQKLICPTF